MTAQENDINFEGKPRHESFATETEQTLIKRYDSKVTTTAADNGSSFFKASEILHADLAAVVYFIFCYK